jgi:hypothetical protein
VIVKLHVFILLCKQALLTRSKENKTTGDNIEISGIAIHKTTAVAPHTITVPVCSKGLGDTV